MGEAAKGLSEEFQQPLPGPHLLTHSLSLLRFRWLRMKKKLGQVDAKKNKNTTEWMITNFKSDYGNLLLSGLPTTELNIPWQIKSGNRKFYDSLRGRRRRERERVKEPKKGLKLQLQSCVPYIISRREG